MGDRCSAAAAATLLLERRGAPLGCAEPGDRQVQRVWGWGPAEREALGGQGCGMQTEGLAGRVRSR